MKKILYLILLILIMPFIVYAQEDAQLYLNGTLTSGEGVGYFFEDGILDLDKYNGDYIEIVGDGTKDINITVKVHEDSIINNSSNNKPAISVSNGSKKANLIIESTNNAKLVINCNNKAIFTNSDLTVKNTNIEIDVNLVHNDMENDESIIYGENILINNSNIKIEQSTSNNELRFFGRFIAANKKVEIKDSKVNLIGKGTSYATATGIVGQYINIDSSTIGVTEDERVITLIVIPNNLERLKDNFVKIQNSNINTTGVIVGCDAAFSGINEPNPNDGWIENVEIIDSSITSNSDDNEFNFYESSLFDTVTKFNIKNSKIESVNADSLVLGVYDLTIDNSEIYLKNAVSGNTALGDSVIANSIKLNKSIFSISNNQENILEGICPKGFHTRLFEATNSNITFSNVCVGIDSYESLKMNNANYKQTGGNFGIHSYKLIDLKSSTVDINVNKSAIDMLKNGPYNDAKQTYNISDDMYYENKSYKFMECQDRWTLSENDKCPNPENYVKKVKILKKEEKKVEQVQEKAKNETAEKENPKTGTFLSLGCILLLSGGLIVYISKSKNKKLFKI